MAGLSSRQHGRPPPRHRMLHDRSQFYTRHNLTVPLGFSKATIMHLRTSMPIECAVYSYIWGAGKHDTASKRQISSTIPATVRPRGNRPRQGWHAESGCSSTDPMRGGWKTPCHCRTKKGCKKDRMQTCAFPNYYKCTGDGFFASRIGPSRRECMWPAEVINETDFHVRRSDQCDCFNIHFRE